MEYTKDILSNVNCGQTIKKKKGTYFFSKVLNSISRHKFITCIIFITVLFMVLDLMLVVSFVNVLSSII